MFLVSVHLCKFLNTVECVCPYIGLNALLHVCHTARSNERMFRKHRVKTNESVQIQLFSRLCEG